MIGSKNLFLKADQSIMIETQFLIGITGSINHQEKHQSYPMLSGQRNHNLLIITMNPKSYIVGMVIFANINIDIISIFSSRRYRYIDMTSIFPIY